jgi:SAM-dependent methyltransferase
MIERRGYFRCIYRLLAAAGQFNGNLFKYMLGLCRYLQNLYSFTALSGKNMVFQLSLKYLYPCLNDWTNYTPVEPTYFFQDTWAARKIFQLRPTHHYDVGSSIMTIGIISQYVPTTIVDIRPINLELENLYFITGSILALPFADESIESLSSLCVVEHIGLGRYGDSIDSWGSEKAAVELKRVLKSGGDLCVSVPVDEECRVYYNAHRAFTRDYVLELFRGLDLVEEKYIYGRALYDEYDGARGFGTGLFHFRKRSS